ncbi:MAG TPA: ABC transporter ATP-binding protein [Candidatus Omnitrophota bacterium]|nr:ABC transporter ATP-binding protein [Candidatus Omnitrophota bacterium]
MQAIHIKDLKKTYANGTVALKGVDLQVTAGDFCALLGANGAGKTTIIGIMTGLVLKTEGSVRIFGHDIDHQHPQAKELMGVVPQELNFNMFEKVQDIIVNQAGYFGIERSKALKDSEVLLKKLMLWEKRDHPSRSLSGGMKRRLMIARALINHPKLLILDEPTAGVDVELRYSMWEFLSELNRQGTTILLTTHYLEEVEQMCRSAAMIKNGEIIAYDRVSQLLKLLDVETYVVHAEEIKSIEKLSEYNAKIVDVNVFEVDLDKKRRLGEFVHKVNALGMVIHDLRPKGNRMDKLFLELLKK